MGMMERLEKLTEKEMQECVDSESREAELENSDFDDETIKEEKDWLDHISTSNFRNPIFLKYAKAEDLVGA